MEAERRTTTRSCLVGHYCWRRLFRRTWYCCCITLYVSTSPLRGGLTSQGPRYHGNFQEAAGRFLTCKLGYQGICPVLTLRRRSNFDQHLSLHSWPDCGRQAALHSGKYLCHCQGDPHWSSDTRRTHPPLSVCFRYPAV